MHGPSGIPRQAPGNRRIFCSEALNAEAGVQGTSREVSITSNGARPIACTSHLAYPYATTASGLSPLAIVSVASAVEIANLA